MINFFEVNETNKMIEQENLDVRTITMGINLLDCIDSDLEKVNETIKNAIEFIPVSSLDEVLSVALESKKSVKTETKKNENTKTNPINNGKETKSTGVYCREG